MRRLVLRDTFSLAKMVEMFRVTEDNEKIMQFRLSCKISRMMACARVKSWEKDSLVVIVIVEVMNLLPFDSSIL